MRVLLIIESLAGGGAERATLTLAEAMVRQGAEVTLLALDQACSYAVPAEVEYLVRSSSQLREFVTQRGPFQLVVSNLPVADQAVRHVAELKDAWFCLHTPHGISQLERRRGLRRWRKARRLRRLYDKRRVIAVSKGVAYDLTHAVGVRPAELQVIFNPIDVARIQHMAAEPCPLDGTSFLLHVGRMHRAKRHDRLLRAYAQSKVRDKLVLLGIQPDEPVAQLRELARTLGIGEQIEFAGFQQNVYSWMRAARVLILSSDYEGFGNVLVEALACGTPVVSTDCPYGPREIMTDELARGLSALDDAGLAAAIDDVVNHPPPIEARDYMRFDASTIAQQYLALAQHG